MMEDKKKSAPTMADLGLGSVALKELIEDIRTPGPQLSEVQALAGQDDSPVTGPVGFRVSETDTARWVIARLVYRMSVMRDALVNVLAKEPFKVELAEDGRGRPLYDLILWEGAKVRCVKSYSHRLTEGRVYDVVRVDEHSSDLGVRADDGGIWSPRPLGGARFTFVLVDVKFEEEHGIPLHEAPLWNVASVMCVKACPVGAQRITEGRVYDVVYDDELGFGVRADDDGFFTGANSTFIPANKIFLRYEEEEDEEDDTDLRTKVAILESKVEWLTDQLKTITKRGVN